jgi:mono/diheme cytochrome c family protein
MRGFVGIVAVVALLFLAAQLYRPKIDHRPVTAEIEAPPEVKQILRSSCYNCHSNETRLSWFDEPAPAYWMVARDVRMARAKLNFSEIGKLPPAKQRGMLFEAVNMIQLGAMPLPSYRRVHPGSTVTAAQLETLKAYLHPFEPAVPSAVTNAMPATTAPRSAAAQTRPVQAADVAAHAQPELNGLAFFPDYKNWRAISSTDRGDNGTMREILGNDIAVRAIASRQIQPWPDGAAFAKVAWQAVPDAQGVLHTGKFVQVELMVKGRTKYASTAGWGFGRWLGPELKPYGKDAHFASECVGCHMPVRDNDFVYTMPILRTRTQQEGQ